MTSLRGQTNIARPNIPEARPIRLPAAQVGNGYLSCRTGTWSGLSGAPYTAPRAAVENSGVVYAIFGSSDFATYDISGGSWTTRAGLPSTISGRGGLVRSGAFGVVYAFYSDGAGGAVTVDYTLADLWEPPLAPMPTPRTEFACLTGAADGVHLIGGIEDAGSVESVVHEVYNQGADTWSTKASLDVPMGNAVGVLGPSGDIFLWGSGSGNAVARVWRKGSNTWEALPDPPWTGAQGDLIVQALVVSSQLLFLIGGGDGSAFDSTSFWTYDPAAGVYTPTGSSATSILDASAGSFSGTEVYAVGSGGDAEKFTC